MTKKDPIYVTPGEADLGAEHPQWVQDLADPTVDLWVALDALAARVAAIEGTS